MSLNDDNRKNMLLRTEDINAPINPTLSPVIAASMEININAIILFMF